MAVEIHEKINLKDRVNDSVTYIRRRVAEITGIPDRRIQFYTEKGLVSVAGAAGKGYERHYSKVNIIEFLIVRAMSRTKIELSRIKDVMFMLKEPIPMVKAESGWRIAKRDEPVTRRFKPITDWLDVDFPLYIVLAFNPNGDMLVQFVLEQKDIAKMITCFESVYIVDFKRIVDTVKAL